MDFWRIGIDTGGTFTDCLAVDPQGQTQRFKILSTGALRGRAIFSRNSPVLRVLQPWPYAQDIYAEYQVHFPAFPDWGPFLLVTSNLAQGELVLNTPMPGEEKEGVDFELTAGEEAPVLAMRLATGTPLTGSLPPVHLRLGFTRGTNALLERNGARVVLLTTEGFQDLVRIGTQQRPDLFQLQIPEPWLPCAEVLEVAERMDARGEPLLPLVAEEIDRIIARLWELAPESVAIAFLHAYRNPLHEELLEKALRAAGFNSISRSSALSATLKWLPRIHTSLIDAYLNPLLQDYLLRIGENLKGGSTLQVMSSSGALLPLPLFHAKDSLLSGPAGGLVGAAHQARLSGFPRTLTLDMGGTSTDVARFDGAFDFRYTTRIGELELQRPTLAIETVAAGGGSVCFLDQGRLRVGPRSAGASPGPACYGAGGPLTLTDVNLLLGKLDTACFPIPVYPLKAAEALEQLLIEMTQAGLPPGSPLEVLKGLERIGNEIMADAIRAVSIARGFLPASYPLLAFGGAGGLHACAIANLLDMDTVLVPGDAGILSAFGMSCALVERHAEREIRLPLHEAVPQALEIIGELGGICREALHRAGIPDTAVGLPEVHWFIRFAGQENALEIVSQTTADLADRYLATYHQLFGYIPEDRPLELVRILVRLETLPEPDSAISEDVEEYFPRADNRCRGNHQTGDYPVFLWENLQPGAVWDGPALLLMPTATTFVEAGWQGKLDSRRMAVLKRGGLARQEEESGNPALALTLFTNRFMRIAAEMGAQLQRTAVSVNVKERLDFSCALLDAEGNLLANAPHIPVHLGSLGICLRLVREQLPMGKGDVVVTNHPAFGGSHLPDITLMQGVFTSEGVCIGYVINRAHHAEIGGRTPGSMPTDARFLSEEGVVIPPFYLAREGIWRWEAFKALLKGATYPSRQINENLADIHAGIASLQYGVTALKQLYRQHGLTKVASFMEQVQEDAHRRLMPRLREMLSQDREAEEHLDEGLPIRVRIAKEGQLVSFDFRGTGGPHSGNLNANIAIVYSVVLYVLRLLAPGDLPLNEGFLRSIRIRLPDDSLLHPHFPADDALCPAVVGGNTEVSQRLTDTLLKAFGLAACSQGTMNNFLFGNADFGFYETIGGGNGATAAGPGRAGVHQHMTNTRLTDVEEMEFRYPVRVKSFAIRKDSGGPGRYRGGDGLLRQIAFLETLIVTFISQHRVEAPYGLEGGEDGQCGQQSVLHPDGTREDLPGTFSRELGAGATLSIGTPGGGGWGRV